MDLTPGERAVLNQLRELYAKTSRRDHPLTRLTTQWPPTHYEAYRKALAGLLKKDLLQTPNNGQALRFTDAGLKAAGFAVPAAASRSKAVGAEVLQAGSRATQWKATPAKSSSRRAARQDKVKGRRLKGVAAGLGLIAIVACAGWLSWRVF
jgi:hypothetical protein